MSKRDTKAAGNRPQADLRSPIGPSLQDAMDELTALTIEEEETKPIDLSTVPADELAKARKNAIKVRDLLKLDPKVWDDERMESLTVDLTGCSLRKISARVLMITGFESLGHMTKALDCAQNLLSDPNRKEGHTAAGQMVAKVGEAVVKLSDHLIQLSGVAQPEPPATKAETPRASPYRNLPPDISATLPPQVNVQVNVGGDTSPPESPPTPAPVVSAPPPAPRPQRTLAPIDVPAIATDGSGEK